MLISQALQGYWLDKRIRFSQATIDTYGFHFRYFVEFVGDIEFDSVTADHVRKFLDSLVTVRKLSNRTKHDAWVPLSSLWTWAEQELGTKHIIRGKVKMPPLPKRVIEIFTVDEIRQMINVTQQTRQYMKNGKPTSNKRPTADRDKAILLTLADTGVRASELCAFTVGDYNDKRGRLHVQHGKGDRERYVVPGLRTQKALWRYMTSRPKAKPIDPLFATRSNGHMTRDNLYHMVADFGARVDVAAYPHKFRHTFAVNFLRRGGNLIQLRDLMGHEDIQTLQAYVNLAEVDIDAAVQYSPVDGWRI